MTTQTLTKREQLLALQAEMQAEQLIAAQTVLTALNAPGVTTLLEQMAAAQQQSIPGQYLDQGCSVAIQTLSNIKTMLEAQIGAAAQQAQQGS